MGLLTPDQVRTLRDYLEKHGLTYELLQTEMLDHICCDVEVNMEEGLEFEQAIEKVTSEIPKNQFRKVQIETMEATNKKIKPSKRLTYLSFSALTLATLFKIMHFPGASQLLIASFVLLSFTLITELFISPLIKERKKGRGIAIVLVVIVIAFLASLCFQMLHLPGVIFLRNFSVISAIIILPSYAVYCFIFPEKVSQHLVIQYLRNEGFSIEKSMLILFAFGISLKWWQNDFVSVIFFTMLFSYGAIYYFIRSWEFLIYQQDKHAYKLTFLIASILVFSILIAPTMISIVNAPLRVVMIWGAFIIGSLAVSVFYFFISEDRFNLLLGFFSGLIAMLCSFNLMAKSILLDTGTGDLFLGLVYNPFVLIGLFIVFAIFFKKPVFRGLLLMTLSMLIFSYQFSGI